LTFPRPRVSRYLKGLKRRGDTEKAKRRLAFLNNHREAIGALDFFTVPTLTFRVLYCFFVIEHGRRRILHFNTTAHPTSEWIVEPLREAFPLPIPFRYVVLDRDAKFNPEVLGMLAASGIQPIRTSIRSPWQNGVAERWVGSCRRDMLDHVIPLTICDGSAVNIWPIITTPARTTVWETDTKRPPSGIATGWNA
jgi:putative transposase